MLWKYTIINFKNYCRPSFPWTLTQKRAINAAKKKNLGQNTVYLEQQIYASKGNFT